MADDLIEPEGISKTAFSNALSERYLAYAGASSLRAHCLMCV